MIDWFHTRLQVLRARMRLRLACALLEDWYDRSGRAASKCTHDLRVEAGIWRWAGALAVAEACDDELSPRPPSSSDLAYITDVAACWLTSPATLAEKLIAAVRTIEDLPRDWLCASLHYTPLLIGGFRVTTTWQVPTPPVPQVSVDFNDPPDMRHVLLRRTGHLRRGQVVIARDAELAQFAVVAEVSDGIARLCMVGEPVYT